MNGVVVVDTNVPMAANGVTTASAECMRACRDALVEIMEDRRRLAIDDDGEIVGEYKGNLRSDGAPSIGKLFLIWILTNQYNSARCDRVPLRALEDGKGFEEFPDGEGLECFDPSDRKFVAVANAHAERPPILEGLDSKWWGWREALGRAGIMVLFPCEAEIRETYERKFGVT
jgi:hypothetical protein